MKKRLLAAQILMLAGALGIYSGCNKTNTPFGVNAPKGLDVPTFTPTPVPGSIEVFVQDTGTAIQGVTVFVVDPLGNTLGPSITQPAIGMAPFNPSNLYLGVWTAFVPTQPVSYVISPSYQPQTILHYYFNSSQPFTITGPGQNSVSFTTGGNFVSLAPVSQTYPSTFPASFPVTANYTQNGNLNVPVTAILNYSAPNGIAASQTLMVFGEGVTQQPITFTKNICYSANISLNPSAYDFIGKFIAGFPATIYKNYPVHIDEYGQYTSLGKFIFSFSATNDCGVSWNYSINDTHNNNALVASGSGVSGSAVTFSCSTITNVNYAISSSSVGTFNGNVNMFSITGNYPSAWTILNQDF